MDDRFSWVKDLAIGVASYIPPTVGTMVGASYAKNQTPFQKIASAAIGTATGIYVGALVAESLSLGPKSTIGAGFLLGMMGYDLMLGITAAARNFATDPLSTFKAWWNRGAP